MAYYWKVQHLHEPQMFYNSDDVDIHTNNTCEKPSWHLLILLVSTQFEHEPVNCSGNTFDLILFYGIVVFDHTYYAHSVLLKKHDVKLAGDWNTGSFLVFFYFQWQERAFVICGIGLYKLNLTWLEGTNKYSGKIIPKLYESQKTVTHFTVYVSKCSTLTICCVGEGLKSPWGQTEVLVKLKEKEKLNCQEGRAIGVWY